MIEGKINKKMGACSSSDSLISKELWLQIFTW
jgi:hypothetical protein